MKTPRIILAVALALAAFTHLATASLPAPLPEFKNEQELAQWRAEQNQAAEAEETGQSAAFYTGKPLLATGQYVFLFRNYDSELSRWASEDPSGFPDGANNVVYCPIPTYALDWQGLEVKLVFTVNSKTLTAEDLQTGEKLTINGVLSGTGTSANRAEDDWKVNSGPIPRGDWLVGQQQSNDWYRLYGPNGQGGYSYDHVEVTDPNGNTVVRSGFNLHAGTVSLGCVTVAAADWAALEVMLNSTQTFTYNNSNFTGRLNVRE